MKIRVTVTINELDYILISTEDVEYVERVAAHVDETLQNVLKENKVSLINGAILTAVNIADEYFKEMEAAENLRSQLKEYLEEATKMKQELSEAKRELLRLKDKKHSNAPQERS